MKDDITIESNANQYPPLEYYDSESVNYQAKSYNSHNLSHKPPNGSSKPSLKIVDKYQEKKPSPLPDASFNATLDTEHRYCSVDLLKHIDDNHLLKRISQQVSQQTHLPISTVALMGLGVFSAMVAQKYNVLYQNGMPFPLGLYAVAEQPSGTGKSWCLSTFQMPFIKLQNKALKRARKSIDTLIVEILELTGKKEPSKDDSEIKRLTALVARLEMGLYITNTTPEGLEMTLIETGGFFSAVSSEQGLFNSLLGNLYKPEGSSNNNDMALNGFDGGHTNNLRAGRKSYKGNVVGGITCFAQPGTIEIVLKASNGTGLSERFLMLSEPHSLGKRDHTKQAYYDKALIDDYKKTCGIIESIFEKPLKISELLNLTISHDGWLKINEYRNHIESGLADGGKFSHVALRGSASKINMQIMKLASVLHLMESGSFSTTVDDKHVISAIAMADDLLEANLKLCKDKGIMGVKSEFTSILSLFENDQRPRTERNIIQSKSNKIPFRDFSGGKSALIRNTLAEMVAQKILTVQLDGGKVLYSLAQ